MPLFCDVALAVPLDMVFTYAVPPGMEPVVGGRVLVPFRQQRMSGIVVELHDRAPEVKTKKVIEVLDLSPVLDEDLLKLGQWIADYYLAPLGEVFRTMLPLSAEFKRTITYRIAEKGQLALHLAATAGSSARSQRAPEDQLLEFRVLDYLAEREGAMREASLRGATRASKALLSGMVRKKWIVREDVSAARDPARMIKIAILLAAENASTKKLNDNQQVLIDTLAAAGGRVPVEDLQGLDMPRTTLSTLVRRCMFEIVDEPQGFTGSKLKPRRSPFEFEFSAPQKEGLKKILEAVTARQFAGMLLFGVTGSGKTAVYLAVMREVLEQGRSSILLVPEIGLTPAMAADLIQVFGDEVAILHSGLSDDDRPEQWHRTHRGEP